MAGLSAARDLVRAGRTVRVSEARDRVGGLVRTEQVDGLTIEAGPDALLMQKPAAAQLCQELGLTLISTLTPRAAYVLRGERLVPIPRGSILGIPTDLAGVWNAGMLTWAGRMRVARDLIAPASPHAASAAGANVEDADESVGAFARRRFGAEAAARLVQPLLGGIHAGDIDRLSLRALFPMLLAADRRGGSLMRNLRKRRAPLDEEGAFRSIDGGLTRIVSALANELPPDVVRQSTQVRAIAPWSSAPGAPGASRASDASKAEPMYRVVLSSEETFIARAVILAVPAYVGAELVRGFDAELADECAGIAYASSATISLAYPRASVGRLWRGTGFVVPRGERLTRLLAVSWVTSKWPNRAPDDVVMLRAFAGGTLDEDLLGRDDNELAALVHRDLSGLMRIDGAPILSRVYRWMRASPQYAVGHLDRVARIEQRLTRWPGLFVTGSGFRGVGLPDTIADARASARQVHQWLGDAPVG